MDSETETSFENKVQRIRLLLVEFRQILNDPSYYIYEYFEEIKRQIDHRREDLKLKIDIYSNNIIQQCDESQRRCMDANHDINKANKNFEKCNLKMDKLIQQADNGNIEQSLADIEINYLQPMLNKLMEKYKSELIEHKKLEFNFKPVPIERVFGTLDNIKLEFDNSKILNNSRGQLLLKTSVHLNGREWKLLYRATENGFSASDFHSKCDGLPNTFTAVKAANGDIFGGFTSRAWSSNSGWIYNTTGFVFSLINNEEEIFDCNESYNNMSCGPCLKQSGGFIINSNSDTTRGLRSFHEFKQNAREYFLTDEIEVYREITQQEIDTHLILS